MYKLTGWFESVECTLRVNMSIQLCSMADCPFAEFADDLCDVEGVDGSAGMFRTCR